GARPPGPRTARSAPQAGLAPRPRSETAGLASTAIPFLSARVMTIVPGPRSGRARCCDEHAIGAGHARIRRTQSLAQDPPLAAPRGPAVGGDDPADDRRAVLLRQPLPRAH